MTYSYFELPNDDWYDTEGRIYKDKLIENFNAIENKINELLAVDITSITQPDINNTTYSDVALDDEDKDDHILNFRSFLSICNIVDFPLKVRTDNNNKILSVEYIGRDYKYHIVQNDVGLTSNNPYCYLDTTDVDNPSIEITDSLDFLEENEHKILLGVLKDNYLITNSVNIPGNINFQKVLSDQNPVYYNSSGGYINDGSADRCSTLKLNGVKVCGSMWEKEGQSGGTGGFLRYGLGGGTREKTLDKNENEEEGT
ncbi:MAG: hypothetical protein J6Y02_13210 [Pseudobutyrivibrio sp.]|nr:hypothetical protein [Pseudobutyrivibrio sp.]